MEHVHLVQRDAVRVGRDLSHHRFEALPDCGGADIHRRRAVRREFKPRRLLRPGTGPLDKAGDRDAVIAVRRPGGPAMRAFLPSRTLPGSV